MVTPTISFTPTAVPVITPTVLVTPTIEVPTVTATPGASEIVGRLFDEDGEPLPDVFVYAGDYGVQRTDDSGMYKFSNVPSGAEVALLFRKTGYTFIPPSIEASSGEDADIPVSFESDSAAELCAANEVVSKLVALVAAAEDLRRYGVDAIERGDRESLSSALSRRKNRVLSKLQGRYRLALRKIADLPDTVFECPSVSGCSRVLLSRKVKGSRRQLRALRISSLSAARWLVKSRKKLNKRSRIISRRVNRVYSKAARICKYFPSKTHTCPIGIRTSELRARYGVVAEDMGLLEKGKFQCLSRKECSAFLGNSGHTPRKLRALRVAIARMTKATPPKGSLKALLRQSYRRIRANCFNDTNKNCQK